MSYGRFLGIVEQVADHLREQILKGAYGDTIPGVRRLGESLGVDMKTVNSALNRLEAEGILIAQGAGRQRRVNHQHTGTKATLRIQILLYEKSDAKADYMVTLRHQLQEMGHSAGFAEKTLKDLGMNLSRVARFATMTEADAWIIFAGPRDILEWFASQPIPAFALFGRQTDIRIAGTGPNKLEAITAVVRRLIELKHRRIALLVHEERRKPKPGNVERVFLSELEAQGVPTGSYNLPDWEDNPEGFHRCLKSLFQHTPPTALIVGTLELYPATMRFFSEHGIRVPVDVSLVCTDSDPYFDWCHPPIARIELDSSFWVRKTVRWVNKVARGKDDRQQSRNIAKFIDGGTIGPAPDTASKR